MSPAPEPQAASEPTRAAQQQHPQEPHGNLLARPAHSVGEYETRLIKLEDFMNDQLRKAS